jgi:hypothetical protein
MVMLSQPARVRSLTLGHVTGVVLVLAMIGLLAPATIGMPTAAARQARLPGLFTGDYPTKYRVRPAVIGGWTGDGTGYVGGLDGRPNAVSADPSLAARFGHVHWLRWRANRATGVGVVWGNDCDPDCAGGSWHADGLTKVAAWRRRGHHFTRLAFSYNTGDGVRRQRYKLTGAGTAAPSWR